MQQDESEKTASSGSLVLADGQESLMEAGTLTKKDGRPENLPTAVTRTPPETGLSDEELGELAREIGLTRWKPGRWRSMSKLGQHLQDSGAIQVAMGELVFTNDIRVNAIAQCQNRLRDIRDPESFALVLSQMNTLLSSMDAATKQIIEASKAGLVKQPEGEAPPRLPPPRTPIMITSQNVLVAQGPAPE